MKENKTNQKNKICLISFPRSRSSFLLELLSLHYNLRTEFSIENLTYKFTNRKISYFKYKNRFIQILESLNNPKDRFIIRIHPHHFFAHFGKEFDLSKMFNLNLFNFKQYDNIYVTKRSTVDRISSHYIAKKTGIWTYTKDSEKKPLKNLKPFVINPNDESILDAVKENIVFEKIDQYFKNNSINYECINYEDLITYAKEHNYPINNVTLIETQYDYSKIISNYSDIERYYQEFDLEFRKKLGLIS